MPRGVYEHRGDEEHHAWRRLIAHYGGDVNAADPSRELSRVLPWDRIDRHRKPNEHIQHGAKRKKRHVEIVQSQQQYGELPYIRL